MAISNYDVKEANSVKKYVINFKFFHKEDKNSKSPFACFRKKNV